MKGMLKQLLLLSFDRHSLFSIRDDLLEENRKCLVIYGSIVACGMAVLLLLSLFIDTLVSSRTSYGIAIVVGGTVFLLATDPAKKHPELVVICQYLLICGLLAFGIILGTIVEPNEASASFAVLLFVAPLLFTDLPVRINALTLLSIVVYIFIARATQSPEMFAFNLSVILPYGFANIILTHFTSKMKIERHIYAYEKRVMAEYDQLTGMLNRWSFERDAEAAKNGEAGVVTVCSFDVNSLKTVNDTYGHKAGDELLTASSGAIKKIIGKYGTCYRVGGDEFMAILPGDCPDPEELIRRLDQEAANYHSSYGFTVSIASGIVQGPCESIHELITKADRQMYRHKEQYYIAAGKKGKPSI